MDDKIYIPLGSNCSVAKQLQTHKLRKFALPFDWCKLDINKLINVLENNFIDFEKLEYIKKSNKHNILDEDNFEFIPNTSSLVLKNSYGIKFAHMIKENDTEQIKELENKFITRIERFKNILNNEQKQKIFIRIELSVIKPKKYIKDLFKLIHLIQLKSNNNFKIIILIESLYYLDLMKFIERIIKNDYTLFASDIESKILKSKYTSYTSLKQKQNLITKLNKIIYKYKEQIIYINKYIIFKDFNGFNNDYFRNDINWSTIFNI